jgi:RND family efflux transporter MFP subunit
LSRKPTSRRFVLISLLLVLALVAAGATIAWFWLPHVNVTSTATGPVVQAFYATGTVRPVREYPIKANTAGILASVLVDKGVHVQAGQPLAVVSDPALVFAAAKADAELEEKRKRLDAKTSPVLMEFQEKLRINAERREIADRDFKRIDVLTKSNAVSISDRDVALDKIKLLASEEAALQKQQGAKSLELERELSTAKAARDTAQWELDQQTLRAPVSGVVLDRPTSQGTRVAVNDVVMRIADVSRENLVMRAQVDEEDVTHCRAGQLVRMSLYAFPSQPITGRVRQIYDEADQDRRTFEVDVAFEAAPEGLSAGMTGELAFVESEKQEATVLPSTALQGGRLFVVRDGRLVEPDVRVGLRSVERIEIVSGLQPDDRVVVSPLGELAAGRRVRSTFIEPAAAVPTNATNPANQNAANLKAF